MTHSEKALIRRAKAGDMAAFEVLVGQHGAMVYNLALRMVNDPQEAEDVAQETFVRAWRGLSRFRADSQMSTWLYRIATNLCYNRLPHLKQELLALPMEAVEQMDDKNRFVELALVQAELKDALQTAVHQLPESYRLLITLRHMQGLSYQQIADITQMPLGTVKTGIYRARQLLRQTLLLQEEINHE